VESLVASLIGFGGFVGVAFFLVKGMRKDDVEDAGNRDADKVSGKLVFFVLFGVGMWKWDDTDC
jgi:hypothetical protein